MQAAKHCHKTLHRKSCGYCNAILYFNTQPSLTYLCTKVAFFVQYLSPLTLNLLSGNSVYNQCCIGVESENNKSEESKLHVELGRGGRDERKCCWVLKGRHRIHLKKKDFFVPKKKYKFMKNNMFFPPRINCEFCLNVS